MIEDGSRILRDYLTDSQAVTWRRPSDESDFQTFQLGIVQDGLRAVFDDWASRGGVSTSEASIAQSVTQGFSEIEEETSSLSHDAVAESDDLGDQQQLATSAEENDPFQIYDHGRVHGADTGHEMEWTDFGHLMTP